MSVDEDKFQVISASQSKDLARRLGENGFTIQLPLGLAKRLHELSIPKDLFRDLLKTGRGIVRNAGYQANDKFSSYQLVWKRDHSSRTGLVWNCSLPQRGKYNLLTLEPHFLGKLESDFAEFLTYRVPVNLTPKEVDVLKDLFDNWYQTVVPLVKE